MATDENTVFPTLIFCAKGDKVFQKYSLIILKLYYRTQMLRGCNMLNKLLILFLFIFVATNALAVERKKFGLGVMAGDPSGITAKYMIDDYSGLDAAIGWKTSGDSEFYISSDYLFHVYDLIKIPEKIFPLYFGGGLRFIDRDEKDNKFGIRIPVGVEYLFLNNSLGAFGEVVPIFDLAPDTEFDLEFGIGIRFFF